MFDYSLERQRRINQFTQWLTIMYRRAHVIHHGSCAIIFQESAPHKSDPQRKMEGRVLSQVLVEEVQESNSIDRAIAGSDFLVGSDRKENVDGVMQHHKESNRFIQFSFERDWFCMDLPNNTLGREEAKGILRDRSGFFYLRDLPQFTLYEEDVDGFDPFRKIYLNNDQRSAAEDMAYIFFSLWKFPIDWKFYIISFAFGDGPMFEEGEALP